MSSIFFNFNNTALSSTSRQQLNNILRVVRPDSKAAQSRSGLLGLVERSVFDPVRGLYIPVSNDLKLMRKFPSHSENLQPTRYPLEPFPHPYFTNGLTIPQGWGTETFDKWSAAFPTDRATNTGFLIITIEHDCQTTKQLEELLSWTRGGNGEFRHSPFAKVDHELTHFSDYRGYTIVFTGNKSLHFHFLFSTKHLLNAPWDCLAEHRLTNSQAGTMNAAHGIYWDKTAEIFHSLLHPSLPPDRSLRSSTQWKRSPWALRELDEDSTALGLAKGTIIPQLVIHENIRSRSCRSCEEFLVPADFEASHQSIPRTRKNVNLHPDQENRELLGKLVEVCRNEWGEFPKPISVRMESGQWVIHFRNHLDDTNPSSIVMGDFTKLYLRGQHSFDRDFYLPNDMNADELCESLIADRETASVNEPIAEAVAQSLAEPYRDDPDFMARNFRALERAFSQSIETVEHAEAVIIYRERLGRTIVQALSDDGHHLIRSPEGIGKTSALMHEIGGQILDAALSPGYSKNHFACFAFRSNEQAIAKAKEFMDFSEYGYAVVIRSFWYHYEQACGAVGVEPLSKNQFHDHSLRGILHQILDQQPTAFAALEERRKRLWERGIGNEGRDAFDSATTILFTSHAQARTWHQSHVTRQWYHPDFDPRNDVSPNKLTITRIIFDEPETSEVLYCVHESLFEWLKRTKSLHRNWKKKTRNERFAIYQSEKRLGRIPRHGSKDYSFEECDEWLRLPLKKLEAWKVDYEAIPFGYGSSQKGMYSGQNGQRYYLGLQSWIKDCRAQITFLTTESLISLVILAAFKKLGLRLNTLDLRCDCVLFPVDVPLVIDKRASKQKITVLAETILADNQNAFVIGNGIKLSDPRVKNFQRAKGLNGLGDKDIFVILTFLSAEQYATLNVIGQWLTLPTVMACHFEDQASQAVGRNQGFRKADKGSVTALCSQRLNRNVLRNCFRHPSSRIRLREIDKKPRPRKSKAA